MTSGNTGSLLRPSLRTNWLQMKSNRKFSLTDVSEKGGTSFVAYKIFSCNLTLYIMISISRNHVFNNYTWLIQTALSSSVNFGQNAHLNRPWQRERHLTKICCYSYWRNFCLDCNIVGSPRNASDLETAKSIYDHKTGSMLARNWYRVHVFVLKIT